MKTVIIYASTHHGNTRTLVRKMAVYAPADLIDICKIPNPDISSYDIIGFASGIYFNSMHRSIQNFIKNTVFQKNQKVFLIATCGVIYRDHTRSMKKLLKKKGVSCLGSFICRGYDTYAIFGKIGGIAKGHPNEKDFLKAKKFMTKILS